MTIAADRKATSIETRLQAAFPSLMVDVYVDGHSIVIHAEGSAGEINEYTGDRALIGATISEVQDTLAVLNLASHEKDLAPISPTVRVIDFDAPAAEILPLKIAETYIGAGNTVTYYSEALGLQRNLVARQDSTRVEVVRTNRFSGLRERAWVYKGEITTVNNQRVEISA